MVVKARAGMARSNDVRHVQANAKMWHRKLQQAAPSVRQNKKGDLKVNSLATRASEGAVYFGHLRHSDHWPTG